MKLIRLPVFIIICMLATLSVPASAFAAEFVPGIDDLPLPAGLSADTEKTVEFDSPEGRIVDAVASGLSSRKMIEVFYRRTLPQLGWHAEGDNRFRRGRERLSIEISDGNGAMTVVRFVLRPGTQKTR